MKRNIGHLCHDEPRESEPKKKTATAKTASTASVDDSDTMSPSDLGHSSISSAMGPPPAFDGARQRANSGIGAGGVLGQGNPLSLVQPDASSGLQSSALSSNGNANQCKPCQKKIGTLPPFPPLIAFGIRSFVLFSILSKCLPNL